MPDFIGRYVLIADPPLEWEKRVMSLARDMRLEIRATTHDRRDLTITCRVTKNVPDAADVVARVFFEQAVAALAEPEEQGNKGVMLVRVDRVLPRWRVGLQRLVDMDVPMLLSISVVAGVASMALELWGVKAMAFCVGAGMGIFWLRFFSGGSDSPKDATSASAAERLAREVARDEDPKRWRRIEAARVALRRDTGRMRMDADQLWRRSVRVGRTAVGVFMLALVGPAVPASLILRNISTEWYLMFGGFGLAAVPLLIGTAMLRHEAKLREQYREVSREVANLERLDLALEYARIESEPNSTHAKALEQVVTHLLSLPPASATPAPAAPGGQSEEKEAEGVGPQVARLFELAINALPKTKGS